MCCWAKTTVDSKMPWVLEATSSNYLNFYLSGVFLLNIGDAAENPF
jgi:hypothetical protein